MLGGGYLAIGPFSSAQADCALLAADQLPEVVIYGTDWCVFCKRTRWFFEDHRIAYCEYDIETSEVGADRYRALGGKALPLVIIGRQRVDGYDKDKLTAALHSQGML